MKPTPTLTLNPLPFNDLEPHRFEDLIRQLAYDLRRWKSLEATGRGGADRGIDIRGIELVPANEVSEDGSEEDEDSFLEQLWIFQCKREKALPPKRIRKVIRETLRSSDTPPHGFVLAAACDISKQARDVFREEMVSRGIEEFFIWAKSELEDLLFQPRNDRLLFAYFGIALQPKRRNLSTALRSEIAKKKQLTALIGEQEERTGKLVLLRDPTDERYPYKPKRDEPTARWLLCRALTLRKPRHLLVLQHEHLAAISADGKSWDAIPYYDTMLHMADGELRSAYAWGLDDNYRDRSPYDFWNEYIDESQRAFLKVRRAVPLERILAIDPLGDGFFPIPHILVDFGGKTGPFAAGRFLGLERAGYLGAPVHLNVTASNRARIFPKTLPSDDAGEPEGFDNTGEGIPLTATTDEKLQLLLTDVASVREVEIPSGAAVTHDDESRGGIDNFRGWREQVAHPVFSSFVTQLRAAGHRARVVIRSIVPSSESDRWDGLESVELKVKLRVTSHYIPPGHVRISIAQRNMVWQADISPPAKQSGNYGSSNPTSVDKGMPKEQLEALVLTMLQRLKG